LVPRTTEGGLATLVDPEMEDAGFLVAFTERSGGVSDGIFRALNLGLRSGDDPELVKVNRNRLCRSLGIAEFACAQQVHATHLQRVGRDEAGAGFMDPAGIFSATDGLLTDERGVALAVLAADCVPVALAHPATGRLAVVHAGWRGVAAGIVTEALKAFDQPRQVLAAIGPAIGPDHYEVGEDVAAAVDAATSSGAAITRNRARVRLDLPATVAGILEDAGVRSISGVDLCTACEADRFFSYRRDGRGGRQAVVAVALP
jgi:YfiH family protein